MTDHAESAPGKPQVSVSEWKRIVARYEEPSAGRATWQIVNTFGLYFLLWVLMYWSLAFSFWATLPLAALAGALLVRVFIIFHDCGHGSFFRSSLGNAVTGFIAGMLTFTPFYHWRWQHALHHATSGDLDRRGTSDIWTMTVQEYLESSRWKRFAYRLARNPFVLFVIAPVFVFLIRHRFSSPKAGLRERHSVWWMNGAALAMAGAMSWWFGIVPYLLIQLIVMMVAGAAGVWLFYVQHQFEDAYWERGEAWNYTAAALQGSSFYKLPRILQWFSGNIGYHHVHHLSSRIPNYNLERCHKSHPLFQELKPITLVSSLHSLTIHLWDEGLRKLVGFRHLRKLRREEKRAGREGSGDRNGTAAGAGNPEADED